MASMYGSDLGGEGSYYEAERAAAGGRSEQGRASYRSGRPATAQARSSTAREGKESLTHAEWAALQEQRRDDARLERDAAKEDEKREAERRKARAEVEFKEWLLRKDKYERALDLLSKTAVERASDDAKWKALGVAVAACDVAIGIGKSEWDAYRLGASIPTHACFLLIS